MTPPTASSSSADELPPDDLPLRLGVAHAVERREESVLRVDHDEPDACGRDVVALHLLRLALAQQAVVDEHTGELIAHSALDQRGSDGESTPPESPQTTRPEPTCRLIASTCSSMTLVIVHVGRAARYLEQEVLEDPLPVLTVHDLRVELDASRRRRASSNATSRARRRTRP